MTIVTTIADDKTWTKDDICNTTTNISLSLSWFSITTEFKIMTCSKTPHYLSLKEPN